MFFHFISQQPYERDDGSHLQGEKTGGVFTFVPPALQGLHGYKCALEMGPGDPAEVSVWSQHQESVTWTVQPQSPPSTGPCPHRLPPWADDLSSLRGEAALQPFSPGCASTVGHSPAEPPRPLLWLLKVSARCWMPSRPHVASSAVRPEHLSTRPHTPAGPPARCPATPPPPLPGSLWSQSSDFFT